VNLSDQIEQVARAATAEVAAASRTFSLAQQDLAKEYAAQRSSDVGAQAVRAGLEEQADAADALPGIMLPADVADSSPHLPPGDA